MPAGIARLCPLLTSMSTSCRPARDEVHLLVALPPVKHLAFARQGRVGQMRAHCGFGKPPPELAIGPGFIQGKPARRVTQRSD